MTPKSEKEIKRMRPFDMVYKKDSADLVFEGQVVQHFNGYNDNVQLLSAIEKLCNYGYQNGYLEAQELYDAKDMQRLKDRVREEEEASVLDTHPEAEHPQKQVKILGDTSQLSSRLMDSMKRFAGAVDADQVTFIDKGNAEELHFVRGSEAFSIGAYGNRMDGGFFGYPQKMDDQPSLSKGV